MVASVEWFRTGRSFVSQELVDGLYRFRDHYFETHSVEEASRKQNDVTQEMTKTLKRLEEKEGEFRLRY